MSVRKTIRKHKKQRHPKRGGSKSKHALSKKVSFRLKKNTRRRHPKRRSRQTRTKLHRGSRHYTARGGNLLPQFITDIGRSGEHAISNTINTLKGTPLTPSPLPSEDQPIDQDAVVVV